MSSGKILHDQEEPNSKVVGLSVFLTGLFVLIVFVVGANFFLNEFSMEMISKANDDNYYEINKMKVEAHEAMHTLKWMDKASGKVQLPIEMAMQDVVRDYRR